MIWPRFGCASKHASAGREQQQAGFNAGRLRWFDFSCAGRFLVSCDLKTSRFIKRRTGTLRRWGRAEPKPSRSSQRASPGMSERWGWRLSSAPALPIYSTREKRPCPCPRSWLLTRLWLGWSRQGLISVGTAPACRGAWTEKTLKSGSAFWLPVGFAVATPNLFGAGVGGAAVFSESPSGWPQSSPGTAQAPQERCSCSRW